MDQWAHNVLFVFCLWFIWWLLLAVIKQFCKCFCITQHSKSYEELYKKLYFLLSPFNLFTGKLCNIYQVGFFWFFGNHRQSISSAQPTCPHPITNSAHPLLSQSTLESKFKRPLFPLSTQMSSRHYDNHLQIIHSVTSVPHLHHQHLSFPAINCFLLASCWSLYVPKSDFGAQSIV